MSLNRYVTETKMYLEKDKEYLSNIWSISGHGGSNTLSNTTYLPNCISSHPRTP